VKERVPGWTSEVTAKEASFPGAFSGMKAAAPPTVGYQLIAVTGKVEIASNQFFKPTIS
jgi:hypothetical protein